jgi:predicted MFS family arabinose efflux permease
MGAAAQIALAVSDHLAVFLAGALVLSTGVQGGKIAADTIVQRDVADSYRGRAFAFYDLAFNAALLMAAVIAVLVLPPSGYSSPLMGVLAAAYALIGLTYWRLVAAHPRPNEPKNP